MKRITPQDVGRRVSVRRELPREGPRPAYTDVVGELVDWTEGVLTITRKDGSVARVAEASIVAAKVVPPPVQRLSPARLQDVASRSWPAPDLATLGEWLLRAADGFTRRANSTLVLGEPAVPFEEALDRVNAWYAERGLPTLFQIAHDDPFDRFLAAAGWPAEGDAIMRTGRLVRAADVLHDVDGSAVRIDERLTDGWLALYHHVAGPAGAAERHVLQGPPGTLFASVSDPAGGDPVAIGRVCVQGRYAGFAALEVDPAHRRHGIARAIMRVLTDRALERGAVTGWLQVESDNEPARALYDALGFTDHHRYHYRRSPVARP
ncbi:GNAT family N-acetyltransferase [Embleya sp. NBC_00896]|uniref:GNAT family N-acetyltransferase n=1 Tax=Embleya sp. NBC_00896 TaxID=2975961 RepID=UPI00386EE43C|nr:GNAT family N-acetyltransferase [Embleya sp. NBC_00896]